MKNNDEGRLNFLANHLGITIQSFFRTPLLGGRESYSRVDNATALAGAVGKMNAIKEFRISSTQDRVFQ